MRFDDRSRATRTSTVALRAGSGQTEMQPRQSNWDELLQDWSPRTEYVRMHFTGENEVAHTQISATFSDGSADEATLGEPVRW